MLDTVIISFMQMTHFAKMDYGLVHWNTYEFVDLIFYCLMFVQKWFTWWMGAQIKYFQFEWHSNQENLKRKGTRHIHRIISRIKMIIIIIFILLELYWCKMKDFLFFHLLYIQHSTFNMDTVRILRRSYFLRIYESSTACTNVPSEFVYISQTHKTQDIHSF